MSCQNLLFHVRKGQEKLGRQGTRATAGKKWKVLEKCSGENVLMVLRSVESGCWSVQVKVHNRGEYRGASVWYSDKGGWALVCDLKN